MKQNQSAKAVLERLREAKKNYDRLLGLVKEQLATIQQEDENRLQAIVEEKEILLKNTRKNETQAEQMLGEMSGKPSVQIEREVESLKSEMAIILEQIIALENDSQTELLARKFLTQEKILDLKERKTLLKGYKTSQRIKPKISKSV